MATDDSNNGPKVKVLEYRGQEARDLMEKLGLEFSPPPVDERPWTKARMVAAFGDFLDGSIIDFARDMGAFKMNEKDIFEALHVAIAHNLGAIERGRAYVHNHVNGKEGPRDEEFHLKLQAVSQENIHIGWDHKNDHLTKPDFKCKDPYKVGESDEDSPASA